MSVYAEGCSDCLVTEPVIVPPAMGDFFIDSLLSLNLSKSLSCHSSITILTISQEYKLRYVFNLVLIYRKAVY